MRPFIGQDASEDNLTQPLNKRMGRYAPRIGGILIATTLLVQQVIIESKGNPERRNMQSGGTSLRMASTDIEKSVPKIVADNQQIFEFLDGNVDGKDTYLSLHQKLRDKLEYMRESDVASDNIRLEIRYRLEHGMSNSVLLMQALSQTRHQTEALERLSDSFEKLTPTERDVSTMNDLLIDYYSTIEGDSESSQDEKVWKAAEWQAWGDAIEKLRIEDKYRDSLLEYLREEKWNRSWVAPLTDSNQSRKPQKQT